MRIDTEEDILHMQREHMERLELINTEQRQMRRWMDKQINNARTKTRQLAEGSIKD